RIAVAGDDRWRQLGARVVDAAWTAARHQGFVGIPSGVPQPHDVLLNVHRSTLGASTFEACALAVEWMPPTHRYGAAAVAVHDFGASGAMTLVLDLNETRFPTTARAAFAASLLRLIDDQLDDPEQRIGAARAATARPSASVAAPTVWSRFVAQ